MRPSLPLRTRVAMQWGIGFFVLGGILLLVAGQMVRHQIERNPETVAALFENQLGLDVENFEELAISDPEGNTVDGEEARLALERAIRTVRSRVQRAINLLFPALAVVAGIGGWWMAGRMVAPVRTVTGAVRRVSHDRLDARIGRVGPDDELQELAEAFDSMMERLERGFAAQRTFAAAASHELRTPLTLIRTELDVAMDGDREPGEIDEMAEAIRAALSRSERVINGLLQLSTSGIVDTSEVVAMAEVAAEVVDSLRSAAAMSDVDIEYTSQGTGTVAGDPHLLDRLVFNLVDNAIRYSPPGATVHVSCRSLEDSVELSVSNPGEALAPDTVHQLTEPFRRGGARTSPGTGLGLAIVESIVEAHGGSLRLEARSGGGLVVRAVLPSAPAKR